MAEGTEGRKLRFRVGHVSVPANPAERVKRHLDNGQELWSVSRQEIDRLIEMEEDDQLLALLDVVREHDDHHRVYAIHKYAASRLAAEAAAHTQGLEWARYYDLVPGALVLLLEQVAAEPELLNLLGLAYYELGDSQTALHIFETVATIEPEHALVHRNLAAARERVRSGLKVHQLPPQMTARSRALAPQARQVSADARAMEPSSVSLVMIVKDEEEMLPGCLAAMQDHVDEMIVVDTGSTDRTREIAEEYGAKLIEFPWTGSFSEARNVSLDAASSEWVIYLDADEHVVEDDAKHLKKLARKRWLEGIYLVETNFTGLEEMGGQTTHLALRMFRNRPEYRFEGIVHEQKLQAFPTYLPERFQTSPVRVNHYGYLKQRIDARDKRERNLSLLLAQRESEAPNAFVEFNIGSEYTAMDDWATARSYLERAFDLARAEREDWQSTQFAPLMVARLITARRTTGDVVEALSLIEQALEAWPDFTDVVFERALINLDRRDLAEAGRDAEHCLAMGDAPAKYVSMQGKGTYQARMLLATVQRESGDFEAAVHTLTTAWAEAPGFLPIVVDLADALLQAEEPDAAAASIDELVADRSSALTWLLVATAFAEHGAPDLARRYYERVLETAPANVLARIGLAELQLAAGHADDAISTIRKVDRNDPLSEQAAQTEFLALVVAGAVDDLSDPLSVIVSAGHLSTGEKALYTAWKARLIGETALLPADADAAGQIIRNLEALAKLTVARTPEESAATPADAVASSEAFETLLPLLEPAVPDERIRNLLLGGMYLRLHFPDMAGQQFMANAERFGPDAPVLTGLGKVATMKEMWDDAEVFLTESLQLDPLQRDARKLLELIRARTGAEAQAPATSDR
jgi:tetratricopeptide (TPR) repeat protein